MIQCQGCTCAGWLWEGEGGLGDHQPGVYVPLKALFLVESFIHFSRNVRQWRQRNKNQKTAEDDVPPSEPAEAKEETTSDKENENANSNINSGDNKTEETNKADEEKDEDKEVKVEGKDDQDNDQDNSQDSVIPKPPEDIDIIDNTECKFNVNSFKLVYVVNSESYLYKRMALKRAREVRLKESMMGLKPRQVISGKFSDYSSFTRGSAEDETQSENEPEISLLRPQPHH